MCQRIFIDVFVFSEKSVIFVTTVIVRFPKVVIRYKQNSGLSDFITNRTAGFMNKQPLTIDKQIELLKSRGMKFKNENFAKYVFSRVSYYRLKGYWWNLQSDKEKHIFNNVFFEDVLDCYNFDKQLKFILFEAIEIIEVGLRTQLIYQMSLIHGGLWHLNEALFGENKLTNKYREEYEKSKESFIIEHKKNYRNEDADAWLTLEIVSLGTLSKTYSNLINQLPEKAKIANNLGLNSTKTLSSWLEAITIIRNIIAHHSRIYDRDLPVTPYLKSFKTKNKWLNTNSIDFEKQKTFLIISCILYLCNNIQSNNDIKDKLLKTFKQFPSASLNKIGFIGGWDSHPIWV